MFTIAPFTIYAFLGWEKIGDWRDDLDLDWVRVWSSWPRGMGEIIPNPHFRFIFTSVFLGFTPPSYPFINATVRIPVTQFWWICTKVSFPVSKVHPWMGKIGLNTFLFTESFGCQETRGKVVGHYHGTLWKYNGMSHWCLYASYDVVWRNEVKWFSSNFCLKAGFSCLKTDLPSGIIWWQNQKLALKYVKNVLESKMFSAFQGGVVC